MLFDLRSPGRRLAVKGIYLALAIILGGGLVFFGIGSGVDGGLFNAFSDDQQRADDDAFIKRADTQAKKAAADPTAANYALLARLRVQAAGFDDAQQTFTDDGKEQLAAADVAWQRSLKLAGDEPDVGVAAVMQRAYDPGALNQPEKGMDAMQIIIDSERKPTAQQYAQLAYWAYLAKDERMAKLARGKALDLAPPDDRERILGALDSYKQASEKQTAAGTTGGG